MGSSVTPCCWGTICVGGVEAGDKITRQTKLDLIQPHFIFFLYCEWSCTGGSNVPEWMLLWCSNYWWKQLWRWPQCEWNDYSLMLLLLRGTGEYSSVRECTMLQYSNCWWEQSWSCSNLLKAQCFDVGSCCYRWKKSVMPRTSHNTKAWGI